MAMNASADADGSGGGDVAGVSGRGVSGRGEAVGLRCNTDSSRLAGWQAGRLAGWQAGRLAGWQAGRCV